MGPYDDAQTIYVIKLSDMDWEWTEFTDAVARFIPCWGKPGVRCILSCGSMIISAGQCDGPHARGRVDAPPNIRHTVIVNATGSFLESVVTLVDRVQGWVGPKIVPTMEEARDYLAAKVLEDQAAD